MVRKITARRKIRSWRHRGAKRKIAHARKMTWKVKDRGKKGKTPKAKRWKVPVKKLHRISGYKTKFSAKRRRRALVHEVIQRGGGRKGTRSTFRTLVQLYNVNPSRKAKKVFKADANYVGRKYGFKLKK